jgi:hypothetical protein
MPSGSIRKVTIDGITYNAAADANASKTPTATKEGIPHSGGNMMKITKAHGSVEGLTLILTESEYETLEAVRDSLESKTLSYTTAGGAVWRTQGGINLDNYETEENRCDVMLIPETGTWDLFAN